MSKNQPLPSTTAKSSPNILDTGIGAVAKYNPHLWGPDELKAIFVVRQKELKQLIHTIEQTDADIAPQHQLLIGQRGMGKTTLLQRIALYVDENEKLNQNWLALRFPEEQYTVSNLAELWGNVLGALADALEAKGQPTLTLDQQLMQLDQLPANEREAQSLAIINQWCEQQNKRLLLLIDSTDLLFDNLNDRKKTNPNGIAVNLWRLRKTLQSNKNLFWLGGSYQALEANDLYHDAFQDFFQLTELKPLSIDEVHQAMRAMARTFNSHNQSPEVAEQQIIQTLKQRPERLKTLRLLTGGNPRTTVMLFELFSTSSEAQVRSDLERLLDMMTPLYKARLEALPDQQRKVIAHIMEAWQPIGLGSLATVANMANTQVSPLLHRMEKEGLIVKAPLPNTTKAGYQTAERFFNIWYLMRNAPRRLKLRLAWLVEFMRMWYKPIELEHIAHSRMHRHNKGNNQLEELEYSRAVASALPHDSQSRHALDYELYKQLQQQREKLLEFFDFEGQDQPIKSIDDYCQRFSALKANLIKRLEDIGAFESDKQQQAKFCHLLVTAIDLTIQQKEHLLEQKLTPQKLLEIKQELEQNVESWQSRVGKTKFNNFCHSVEQQNIYLDLPDANIAFIQIKQLIDTKTLYWHFTNKLWQNINDNTDSSQHNNLVDQLIVDGLQHPTNAAKRSDWGWGWGLDLDWGWGWAQFEQLIMARRSSQQVSQALEQWVKTGLDCNNKDTLFELGYLLQAGISYCDLNNTFSLLTEKAYLKALELNPNNTSAWNNLGILYADHLQQYDQAKQAYLKAIELNPNDTSAWYNLGNLYTDHLQQYDQAEQAYLKALELNPNNTPAWNNLGNLYVDHLQQYDQAEHAYLKALELNSKYYWPYFNLAQFYAQQNKIEQATSHYHQGLTLQPPNSDDYFLALQGHLWLNDMPSANQALTHLAQAAMTNNFYFFRLKEQCWGCQKIGRGMPLAKLMMQNPHAEFLRPFELALREVNGDDESKKAAPAEVQQMVDEIVTAMKLRLS